MYQLPLGKGQRFGSNLPRVVDKVLGGWRTGAILNLFTGTPISFTSGRQSFNAFSADNNADAAGVIGPNIGSVTVAANGVQYFSNLKIVDDPYRAQLTTLQNVRATSVLFAIADGSGNVILRNPIPGKLGNLADNATYGPGSFRLDVRLSKSFMVSEGKQFQINFDAENASNSPQWNNPNTDINSASFGRITGAGGTRILAVTGRFDF